MNIDIALGRHSDTKSWEHKATTWDWLVQRCSTTYRTPETVKQYDALGKNREGKDRQNTIKSMNSAFVGGMLLGGSRAKSNVLHRQVLCLDADTAMPSIWRKFKMLVGCSAFMYTTHKHTPGKWRVRIVILLDREVTVNEYEPIARRITATLGIEQFDKTTYDFNRYMYFPTTSSDGEFIFEELDGEPLDCDAVLASYRDYLNEAEWPLAESENKEARLVLNKLGDPLSKPGIIGAFCRVYNVKEAIAEFLSDVYEPTDTNEDRYTYTGGSTSGGLVVYDDDLKCFSNHGTDPMSGKGANAFDLCRVHLFGDQDSRAKDDTPVNRLPSHLAMVEFARKIPEVSAMLVEERINRAMEDFGHAGEYRPDETEDGEPVDEKWKSKLEVDKKGNVAGTIANVYTVLKHDPLLKGTFAKNEFENREVAVRDLPWRKVPGADRGLVDADDSQLIRYMETVYGVAAENKIKHALVSVINETGFHPVRDYLNSLVWDGEERLDRLFVEYLGATDDAYMRAVTRKSLTAAVARIFNPGCKFDYMTVFVGKPGAKKSTIIDKLGGEWFSDSLGNIETKEALENLQGVWLMEAGELAGMKRASIDAIKHFVTKRIDQYRASYGRRKEKYPRQCVFFATTNTYDFLSDPTGNRKFWAVDVDINYAVKDPAEDLEAERDQIWAEAVVRYRNGEKLYLSKKLELAAKEHQSNHTEKDSWEESILQWLDEPYSESDFGNRTSLRDRVSIMGIWVECLLGHRKDITIGISKRITNIMNNVEGWEKYETRTMFKDYGNQRGYRRSGKTTGSTTNFNNN